MDILISILPMFVLCVIVNIGRDAYRKYVEKNPELNETPEQRKKRKELERRELERRELESQTKPK